MAFNKRTWKGRQGTGLNKFSIDGDTPVTIINQPDSITEQGDALSAGNLNDLETRIDNAFTEIYDGDVVVGKAEKDANGNVIITTYETKADANDLKNALSATNARVTNLEQKAGGYSVVNYRGTNAVPSGKAEYAMVESIVGKSRAWNMGLTNADFSNGFNDWWYQSASTNLPTVTDGVCSFLCTGQNGGIYHGNIPIVGGHKYLVAFLVKATTASTSVNVTTNMTDTVNHYLVIGTSWQWVYVVETATTTSNNGIAQFRDFRTGSFDTLYCKGGVVRDLTTILSDWSASDITTANIPLMVQQIPDLLKYDAYGYSLVDTVVSGVRSVGYNLLDPTNLSQIGSSNVETTNSIKVVGGQTYQFNVNESQTGIYMEEYDINGNKIKDNSAFSTNKLSATLNVSTASVKLSIYKSGGITVAHVKEIEPCFHVGTTVDYKPFISDTLSLPSPVTLRSAGSVAEVLTLETGKKTRPIGRINLKDMTWVFETWNGLPNFYARDLQGIIKQLGNNNIPNAICDLFEIVTFNENQSGTKLGLSVSSSGNLDCRITNGYTSPTDFANWVKNHYLTYELINPDTDEQVCDPVIDNTIQTEGGGTINTIQTQTTKIDNCLDVGYLAV